MSIVQSVLLLLCLGLVIFSRVSAAGHVDFPGAQNRARNLSGVLLSPPESPVYPIKNYSSNSRPWPSAQHRRQRSAECAVSRSRSRNSSPPTPVSVYSKSENAHTPQSSAVDEILVEVGGDLFDGDAEGLESPIMTRISKQGPSAQGVRERSPGEAIRSFSPARIATNLIRQTVSPTVSNAEDLDFAEGDTHDSYLHERNEIDLCTETTETGEEQLIGIVSSILPSPPPEKEKPGFNIARKPLPALPPDGA